MEKLLELEDITLLVSSAYNRNNFTDIDLSIVDPIDNRRSLPIFTSPSESVVGPESWRMWEQFGIRSIIPVDTDISIKLNLCHSVFTEFSIEEIEQYFIKSRQQGGIYLKIHAPNGNGHFVGILETGSKLKQTYGNNIILMGGNVNSIETFTQYSKVGFDYIIVGDTDSPGEVYGFHYPIASLLIDLVRYRATAGVMIRKDIKVVANIDLLEDCDILKAMALGANYVMIGRSFAKIVEAEGPIYKKDSKKNKKEEIIDRRLLLNKPSEELIGFCRPYEVRERVEFNKNIVSWKWVSVDKSIKDWFNKFKEVTSFGFMITNSRNWTEFKKNVMYNLKN